MHTNPAAPSRILRPAEAARYLGVCRTTLYEWEKSRPDFPRRIRLGERVSGWRLSDLDAWLARRAGDTE